MKKVIFSFFTLCFICTSLFIVSCDKIDDLTTIPVELGDISFVIPLNVDSDKTPAQAKSMSVADDFISFSGQSQKISLQDEIFEKINGYNFSSVTFIVTDVTIKITVSDESGTIVRNFTSTVTGADIEPYIKESNINLGEDFKDSKLTTYMRNIFTAIQNEKEVVINVSGETDIVPSGVEGATIAIATIIPTIKAEIKLLNNKD